MDTIIERIKKLLALANNNPDPKEAESAMALASKLMLKHSISQESIDGHTGKSEMYNEVMSTGKFATWQATLLIIIARSNLCEVVKIKRDDYTVLGVKANVQVTREMYEWLSGEIHRHAQLGYAKKDARSNYGSMDPHRFHTSFKHGANTALSARLHKVTEEVKSESTSNASALMVISNKVAVYTKEVFPKTIPTKSRAGENSAGNAFGAGHKVGSELNLKPTKLIGG